jgi:maleate cis-trans isomerase
VGVVNKLEDRQTLPVVTSRLATISKCSFAAACDHLKQHRSEITLTLPACVVTWQ